MVVKKAVLSLTLLILSIKEKEMLTLILMLITLKCHCPFMYSASFLFSLVWLIFLGWFHCLLTCWLTSPQTSINCYLISVSTLCDWLFRNSHVHQMIFAALIERYPVSISNTWYFIEIHISWLKYLTQIGLPFRI